MATAWGLFKQSIDDILDNLVPALQVSVLPMLIAGLAGGYWLERAVARMEGFLFIRGQFVWWMWALALLLSLLPGYWMAVGWHRFLVRGERPWLIAPRIHPRSLWAYVLRTSHAWVVAALVAGAFAVATAVAVSIIVAVYMGLGGQVSRIPANVGADLLAVAVVLVFLYVTLRFAPMIVGAAVDAPRGGVHGWDATDHMIDAIGGLAVMIIGVWIVFEVIKHLMGMTGVVLGGYILVSTWALAMLNVGVLTTVARHAAAAQGVTYDRETNGWTE
jgi:hypothetical protein